MRAQNPILLHLLLPITALLGTAGLSGCTQPAAKLEAGFRTPPPAARPWVYWFWLNSNITREGVTADLEAMKQAGIGGVLIMEVDQGAPVGPLGFGTPEWREMFKFVCAEADRLGLEVNMNNDAGWCGSGGPWVTPENAQKKLVWSETTVEGAKRFEENLPKPPIVQDYYRDYKVLAFPTPAGTARIDNLAYKTVQRPTDFHYGGRSSLLPTRAQWPAVPADQAVARAGVIDLTAKMDSAGRLTWDAPAGQWTVMRFGYTLTGTHNHPTPASGSGLECDKFSKSGIEAHFAGLIGKLASEVGPLAGKTFVATHIDSWETGYPNWSPDFPAEFKARRGYDLTPYLPAMTGRIVENREISERFLWDLRQTISELVLDNYAGHLRTLAHQHGLRLSIEAYTTTPTDELAYAGRADEPMGEFWSWWFATSKPYGFGFTCTEMASAAHVYGRPIVGAEAFTATDDERWQAHPGSIKFLGDWAFCEGINRFVFHRYAMQPWLNVKPGMSMGPWGLHYERTQTWWQNSKAWHEYLARCQYMLRQGLFVADVCYLGAEGAPQSIGAQKRFFTGNPENRDEPRERSGYNFDLCPPEALLTRASAKDGRLVFPDGMSYRVLALPLVETMTPELLTKVKELAEAGVTVIGPRPTKSPSLAAYPQCDQRLQKLANEIWGTQPAPAALTAHKLGRGQVFWSAALQQQANSHNAPTDALGSAKWIWYPEGEPAVSAPPGQRFFVRTFDLDANKPLAAARLLMTADNSFTCTINGRRAGEGHNFHAMETADVLPLLKPGQNFVSVETVNGAENANPAGLIGRIILEYRDGTTQDICTDQSWKTAQTAAKDWQLDPAAGKDWAAAKELGPMGMAPWGERAPTFAEIELFAEEPVIADLFGKLGLPPDFDCVTESGSRSLRYIHRRSGDTDIYFVANKLPQAEQAVCSFRVSGKRPELWYPDTGETLNTAVYDEVDGRIRVPLNFGPHGSVFVIFRAPIAPASQRVVSVKAGKHVLCSTDWKIALPKDEMDRGAQQMLATGFNVAARADGTLEVITRNSGRYALTFADGQASKVEVQTGAHPHQLTGSWDLTFPSGSGAPEHITLDKLISWTEHPDDGVKHFSGTATYTKKFTLSPDWIRPNQAVSLSLGQVAVMAEVTVNGHNLGTAWKYPYNVDITSAVHAGENTLEVKVINLWINRMIGDEQLPEDSDRNPNGTLKAWPKWLLEGKSSPTGRFTFTSWKLWKKDEPLQTSGLLGPVCIWPIKHEPVPTSK